MKKDLLKDIKKQIKGKNKRILFPEGDDDRILKAAEILAKKDLCSPIILGKENKIKEKISTKNIEIINPKDDERLERFGKDLYNLRKNKGLTLEEAREKVKDNVYFGTMMLYHDYCEGLINGASHPTDETFRPPLQIIKTKEDVKTASSYFIMEIKGEYYFFADCAFVVNPTKEQLCEIGYSTASSAQRLGFTPNVAMLSFSTKGSAEHEMVNKVREATKLLKKKSPQLTIDGEIQLDAAINKEVREKKAPKSLLEGNANVLIFPDLNSGNIGYKLVERFANATAIGPISQGMKKPVNDLSRGCSVQDIIDVACITALEGEK